MAPPGKDTRMFVSGEIKDAVEAAGWRWKALDVAVKITMPILLGVCAWTATSILDIDKRVSHIESTRYTDEEIRKANVEVGPADSSVGRAVDCRGAMCVWRRSYPSVPGSIPGQRKMCD